MRDAEADVRSFLLKQAQLTALVDQRIFAKVDPPTNYTPENDGPCILFGIRGGSMLSQNNCLFSPSMQYRCYASTEAEAREVYFTLFDVLNGQSSDGINSQLETMGQLAREPSTNWPFVFCAFSHTIVNQ